MITSDEKFEKKLKIISENFKALRLSKGWTIEELAKFSGIKKWILIRMESERNFGVQYLGELCYIYKIPPYKIFTPLDI